VLDVDRRELLFFHHLAAADELRFARLTVSRRLDLDLHFAFGALISVANERFGHVLAPFSEVTCSMRLSRVITPGRRDLINVDRDARPRAPHETHPHEVQSLCPAVKAERGDVIEGEAATDNHPLRSGQPNGPLGDQTNLPGRPAAAYNRHGPGDYGGRDSRKH
jgi:hypothetical protein